MSVDSHVLGASTVAGGGAASVAAAAHSHHALLIGIIVGLLALIALGFIARKFARRKQEHENE